MLTGVHGTKGVPAWFSMFLFGNHYMKPLWLKEKFGCKVEK
jgi:hypothetical protein